LYGGYPWIDPAWLSSQDEPNRGSTVTFPENVRNYEKQLIEAALAESNGKIAGPNGAAGKLGIPRSTLDAKIKQLKMKNTPSGKVALSTAQNPAFSPNCVTRLSL